MSNGALYPQFIWCKPESTFSWFKAKTGYQLQWSREKRGEYVTRYYPPLSLFRDFVGDIRPDPAAVAMGHILSFANTYGDILGIPGDEYYQLDAIAGRRTVRSYATLNIWRHQVRQMKWAVGLWDQCNNERRGDAARRRARKELQIEIESALKDVTTPSCARLCLNQELELYVYPVNLLAFMWLTLARLLSGEIAEQWCLGCHALIYTGVGPGLKKTGTVTCSAACRKRKERDEKRTDQKTR